MTAVWEDIGPFNASNIVSWNARVFASVQIWNGVCVASQVGVPCCEQDLKFEVKEKDEDCTHPFPPQLSLGRIYRRKDAMEEPKLLWERFRCKFE